MTDLARVQEFVDTSRQLTQPEQLRALLVQTRGELGFDNFALLHRVDMPLAGHDLDELNRSELVALTDYPLEWVSEYMSRNLTANDPMILASKVAEVPFRWAEVPDLIDLTPEHHEIIAQGRAAGIVDGFTVPARAVGCGTGSCHFAVGPGRRLPRENLLLAELVGIHAFHAARLIVERTFAMSDRPRLSPRQRDCVELVGQGKTDWEIAKILDLSPATVKDHLDDARKKYGVSKRVQVVLRAVFDGQIELKNLIS